MFYNSIVLEISPLLLAQCQRRCMMSKKRLSEVLCSIGLFNAVGTIEYIEGKPQKIVSRNSRLRVCMVVIRVLW